MKNDNTISVLIVDEQPVIRWGLQHFLENQANIKVLGEAASISEAFDKVYALKPQVVIIDAWIPGEDGIAATHEFARNTNSRILAFSSRETWDCVESFLNAGGIGFVTKRCPPDEIISAIRAVAVGQRWISPILRKICSRTHRNSKLGLSPREQEVASLVAHGLTSRQIADQLCVSLKTIETHRYRIFKQLKITTRSELVNYAIENGLLGKASVKNKGSKSSAKASTSSLKS
ncbi:MAG: response regulator transcription factor [Armatimonadota bacterium]|nr:response regulator transcription factor [bacterium]